MALSNPIIIDINIFMVELFVFFGNNKREYKLLNFIVNTVRLLLLN